MTGRAARTVLDRVSAVAGSLGVALEGDWPWPDRFRGVLRLRDEALYAVAFSASEDAVSLNVHPAKGDGARLVGHWPRVHLHDLGPAPDYARVETDRYVAQAVDEVESLLRATLVERGLMPEREFPTDAAVRAWLSVAAEAGGPPAKAARAASKSYRRGPALALLATAAENGNARASREARRITREALDRQVACLRAESHVGFLLPKDSARMGP